jgi:TonB family protein
MKKIFSTVLTVIVCNFCHFSFALTIREAEYIAFPELLDNKGISYMYSNEKDVAFVNSGFGLQRFTGFSIQKYPNGNLFRKLIYLKGLPFAFVEFSEQGYVKRKVYLNNDLLKEGINNGNLVIDAELMHSIDAENLNKLESKLMSIQNLNIFFVEEKFGPKGLLSKTELISNNTLSKKMEALKIEYSDYCDINLENRLATFDALKSKEIIQTYKSNQPMVKLINNRIYRTFGKNAKIIYTLNHGRIEIFHLNKSNFHLNHVKLNHAEKMIFSRLEKKLTYRDCYDEKEKEIHIHQNVRIDQKFWRIRSEIEDIRLFLEDNSGDILVKTTDFYENEQIKRYSFNKLNGEKFGQFKGFFRNGNIEIEGEFLKGRRTGKWEYYDEIGRKKAILSFEEDKLISTSGQFIKDMDSSLLFMDLKSIPKIGVSNPAEAESIPYGYFNLIVSDFAFNNISDDFINNLRIMEPVVGFPDVEAEFTGGESAMQKWMQRNLVYPEMSMEMGEQGKVYLRFIVEKDGTISNVEVIKGVSRDLDNEAKRVIRAMPEWKPGRSKGMTVRSSFTMPINFELN